jgi:transcriptional regulator with PAS, ATPase and Fis domain
MTFARDATITPDVLPPKIRQVMQKMPMQGITGTATAPSEIIDPQRCKSLKAFLRTKEKEYLQQILAYTGGDKEKAAKALDISLATLYRKLPEADGEPRPAAP